MRNRVQWMGLAAALCGFAFVSGQSAAHAQAQEQAKKPAAAKTPTTKSAAKKAAKSSPSTQSKAAVARKTPQPPPGPPKGAVEIEPGTFRWVDAKGQGWIYTQSPFGWMKGAEQPGFGQEPALPTDWTVHEEGDSVTFERPYPFGNNIRWTVKKAEMSELEAAVWKRNREQPAASAAGGAAAKSSASGK